MKLKKFKRGLIILSLILASLSLKGCVKESKPTTTDNFCRWALPLLLSENDYLYLEKSASNDLIDLLDIYNTEFLTQCSK